MCGFCNVCICVFVGCVMCGFCNMCVCMCGFLNVLFFNMWLYICVGVVIYSYVHVCIW